MPNPRLGPADWCRAALAAVAEGGVDAIAVEPLAKRLGVSKGSFYWHFKNRDALVAAAAKHWQETMRAEAAARIAQVPDPRERLVVLIRGAFGRRADAGRIEAAFVSGRESALTAAAVRRVTKDRLALLSQAFRELGFSESDARHRATVASGAYVGLFVMRHTNPAAVPPRVGSVDAFVKDLTDLLTRH
ncbi:MAG TPA: TetR/AcrR family transcriptional regulator [Gaiellaceae bacterium]|jgi:AcrR family transcriptional regulator|nr:TetR/AcrR family transcriptional regulator [Gaiellaceae bacterium]